MSLAELQKQVLELPEEERRQFVEWVYDHERELAGHPENNEDGLSPEQVAELQRRLKEIDEHPERLVPWEGTVDRLRQELHAVEIKRTAQAEDEVRIVAIFHGARHPRRLRGR